VQHLITELFKDENIETPLIINKKNESIKDKHKFMQKEIKEKLNALNSPTASIASTNSNKPFKVNEMLRQIN
jgi:hypothetical protein